MSAQTEKAGETHRRASDDFPAAPSSKGRQRATSDAEGELMSSIVLLVGTRKGCFLLESRDRRDWSVRGPFCEGWPVYHAVYDQDSGTIFAAAASEWHGAGVWRSGDLGE